MEDQIINRVSQSGLITIDLEELYPKGERVVYDLKENLFQELILREKDFRAFLKDNDWSSYQDKFVSIYCSSDAIIPTWAYMLLASKLQPFAKKVVVGNPELLELFLFQEVIENLDVEKYRDQRIVIKGCSKIPVPQNAYAQLTYKLTPMAASIMFGEPCSTVPVFKKSK